MLNINESAECYEKKVLATLNPPKTSKNNNDETNIDSNKGSKEKVGFLNCHLFEGTYVGKFYKKIVYHDEERAQKIVYNILKSDCEIFMLAEVWSATLRDYIIKGVQSKYQYSFYPKNGAVIKLDSGLVYLSKKKITKTGFLNYKDLSGFDNASTKCISYIITEDKMGYMCTHLDAGKEDTFRKKNLIQLFDLFKEIEKENISQIIIAGDFNIRENDFNEAVKIVQEELDSDSRKERIMQKSEEYLYLIQEMEKRGLKDSFRLVYSDFLEHPYITSDHLFNSLNCLWSSKNDKTRSRLDYFFVKGINVCDSGVYYDWWAGPDSENYEIQMKAFEYATKDPLINIYPVSDHYGIWLLFNKVE